MLKFLIFVKFMCLKQVAKKKEVNYLTRRLYCTSWEDLFLEKIQYYVRKKVYIKVFCLKVLFFHQMLLH